MSRLRDAFRWNEPQVAFCLMFTLLNCVAVWGSSNPWAWAWALLMWPTCVCLINFVEGSPR